MRYGCREFIGKVSMYARNPLVALLALVVTLGVIGSARSQGWPQRPVRIVVPFAPGGNTDGIARIVGQRLGDAFGQQFIVENRPGAGGALAAEAVARSPADGYTLFLTSVSVLAVLPAMTKTSYDPVRDFAPISNIGTNPNVLITHLGFPPRTLSEFVEYVRARPQKLSYAASVFGSLAHLSMALFLKRAGLEMVPVIYKGGTAPLTDVIAGHVPTYFAPLSDVLPHKTAGAVRLLAVSSEHRAPQIPDVPTLSESGFPDFNTQTWNGLLTPAGTPKEIVDRMAQEIGRATKDPKLVERLAGFGVEPLGNSPDEFAAQIAADIVLWAEAVKIAGVQEK
jgi:tripartite-type tricarboxylate transporter receptor subunit TctC